MRPVRTGSLHPFPQRRLGQIQIVGHRAHCLAVIENESDRLRLEVVVKPPARPPAFRRVDHSGHRIHLSEDVHEIGSSALTRHETQSRQVDFGVDPRGVGTAMSQVVANFLDGQPRLGQMPSARVPQAMGPAAFP
jgi:hypothetical protein